MIKWDTYDAVTGALISSSYVTNVEFYVFLVIGVLLSLIFWLQVKGAGE